MNTFKNILKLLGLVVLSISFAQCASTMKLQENIPDAVGESYYQNWVAGVKGGGSGTNVFIKVKEESMVLDSIYFRGQVAKLTTKPADKQLFIGRFASEMNSKNHPELTSDSMDKSNSDFPFDLDNNDCVISYMDNGKAKYFKIEDLKERPMEALPMSAPPNKN